MSRQQVPSATFQLTEPLLLWMVASLSAVILPHLAHLPIWSPLLYATLAAWRYVHQRYHLPLPNRLIQVLLLLALIVATLATFRTLFGRDAGVTFLVGLMGMKLMELKTRRDAMLLLFLSYFLIITNFLYSQSMFLAAYMLAVMLLISATLVSLADAHQTLSPTRRITLSAALVGQGIPLMIALFLFFPRIDGPVWGLPEDAHASRSGLDDTMSPGNISELSLSDEVAFRVAFDGPIPPSEQLYWRGPVLWWFDGQTWKNLFQSIQGSVDPVFFGDPVRYTITLEPHNKRWLFALELPEAAPKSILSFRTVDDQLHAKFPVSQLARYQLVSYPDYHALSLNLAQRRMALRVPPDQHPQARALAARWRAEENDDAEAIARRALAYFRAEPFVYTLQPPRLLGDTVDEFLFSTRKGFCEHYASAFTILMRAAGIPARVVTGYQGGEVNPLGDYLIVRQRDAHAWSEIWLRDRGWVRVDPTSAVSPSRIEQGIDTALPPQFTTLGFELSRDSLLARWQKNLRNRWDALNNGWNQWVLGYGSERQREFMQSLGIPEADYRHLGTAMLTVVGGMLLAMAVWLFQHRAIRPRDPVRRHYLRLCAKLARRGLARHGGEGPLDHARRVGEARPDLRAPLLAIIRFYLQLRYHVPATRDQTRLFARQVSRFRP